MPNVREARFSRTRRRKPVIDIVYDDGTGDSVSLDAQPPELKEWLEQGNVVLPAHPYGYPNHLNRLAYQDHELCKQPDDDAIVWRYMSFEQLALWLEKKALWFSRCVNFQQSDPFEGTLPDNLQSWIRQHRESGLPIGVLTSEESIEYIEQQARIRDFFLHSLVGCFNLAEHESNAMWQVYGKGDNSVAISTTLGKLKRAFGPYTSYNVLIGKIEYIDYKIADMDQSNFIIPLLHKAPFYEYENELRCLIVDPGDNGLFTADEPSPMDIVNEGAMKKYAPGCYVNLDLAELLNEIVIGPRSAPWFIDAVSATVKKFGIDVPIRHSTLLRK